MKKALALAACLLGAAAAMAQTGMLVTEEEFKASAAAPELPLSRSMQQAGAPKIELISPDINKPVAAPTNIELRFVGSSPAEPRPESFKAMYGAFRIDITQRLLKVARVTKDGISVSGADLPPGKHQLTLTLTDTLGRQTQQVLSFVVQ
jgi:hypothetical protein